MQYTIDRGGGNITLLERNVNKVVVIMERWQNKVAVVTGASSGIGYAIAKDLVLAGLRVAGLARRVERVEEIKNELPADKRQQLAAIKCDVSSEESVNEAFDKVIEHFGAVDILINNAGCISPGQIVDHDVKQLQRVLQTNVMGVVYCTQRAFKSMKERNFDGHIVLINSVAGHKVMNIPTTPQFNLYPPSKFAVTAITEVLRQEFRGLGTKIKITSVSPGVVDTEILADTDKEFFKDCMLKAEDISSAVLYAISTPPHVQIHEMIVKPVGEIF